MSTRKRGGARSTRGKVKYRAEEAVSDDEEFVRTFDVAEKLRSKDFPRFFVKELKGDEVTIEFFQRQGFNHPLFIREKTGLNMNMPPPSFTVTDVRNMVGGRRMIDVMNCATQQNAGMTMKDWEEFFMDPDRSDDKLNVLSLEFSHTKMASQISAPKVVRQIDWVDNVWPRHLKEDQEEATNSMDKMMYPKVQKYCLMSVAGCYTDFHIDFGGTSVWYHILRGKKIFWLIPPTDANLKAYEDWTLSGKQSDTFFGDIVEKCGRVVLEAGNTMFLPSGWIHAVYTPEDSLVFGGNFLHSFSIEKQLRVAQIEEITKVPHKFRFPFFTEMQWYCLDKYVYALLGRSHLNVDNEIILRLFGDKYTREEFRNRIGHPHITPHELFGLKAIVMFIHALPVTRKNVPSLISNPVSLIKDIRVIVDSHKSDNPDLAISGKPLLYWTGIKQEKSISSNALKLKNKLRRDEVFEKKPAKRVPCKACGTCRAKDCGRCGPCTSLPKQMCEGRRCLVPLLGVKCVCLVCGLDGWYAETSITLIDRPPDTNSLMECLACSEISHPTCHTDYGVEGEVSEIYPNSWFCPKCMKFNPPSEEVLAAKLSKPDNSKSQFVVKGRSDQNKSELRSQMSDLIVGSTTEKLKEPSYIFRPPPLQLQAEDIYKRRQENGLASVNLLDERLVMLGVFRWLSSAEVLRCALVCRAWYKITLDPILWHSVNLTGMRMNANLLSSTVQKQPVRLVLDFTNITKLHINWLLPRIPQTKELSLAGLEYNMAVSAINTCNCPMLQELNLSNVSNLNDGALFKLLTTPRDSRPGLMDKKSRLKKLKKLVLNETEISDVSLRYITQYLPELSHLSVSGCWKLTDAGLSLLGGTDVTFSESLASLDISNCKSITNSGIVYLKRCSNLTRLDCTNTQVRSDSLAKFVSSSQHKLGVYGSVVERKYPSHASRKNRR